MVDIIILMCFREFLSVGEFWHFLENFGIFLTCNKKGIFFNSLHPFSISRNHNYYYKKQGLLFLNYFRMNIFRVVHCVLIANPAFSLLQCSPLTQTTIFSSEEKRTAKGLRTTTRLGFSLVQSRVRWIVEFLTRAKLKPLLWIPVR